MGSVGVRSTGRTDRARAAASVARLQVLAGVWRAWLLLLAGWALMSSGAWLQFGPGWAALLGGTLLVAFAVTLVDVDRGGARS